MLSLIVFVDIIALSVLGFSLAAWAQGTSHARSVAHFLYPRRKADHPAGPPSRLPVNSP
ncbi:hypothetical protein GCM10009754_63780 [Amycolatopsis minnesotensis]|uniref:Uncharacterized protein n=1 Tax=Amycolatopsis minnesotensis TaxID=337894 RepID=A0ABN2S1W9_9PSEU